jgi:hypothetical protein
MWVMTCEASDGGLTLAVVGTGPQGVEPSERKKLHALIDSQKGGRSFTQWFF